MSVWFLMSGVFLSPKNTIKSKDKIVTYKNSSQGEVITGKCSQNFWFSLQNGKKIAALKKIDIMVFANHSFVLWVQTYFFFNLNSISAANRTRWYILFLPYVGFCCVKILNLLLKTNNCQKMANIFIKCFFPLKGMQGPWTKQKALCRSEKKALHSGPELL